MGPELQIFTDYTCEGGLNKDCLEKSGHLEVFQSFYISNVLYIRGLLGLVLQMENNFSIPQPLLIIGTKKNIDL